MKDKLRKHRLLLSACRLLSEVFGSKSTLSGDRHVCLWNFRFQRNQRKFIFDTSELNPFSVNKLGFSYVAILNL